MLRRWHSAVFQAPEASGGGASPSAPAATDQPTATAVTDAPTASQPPSGPLAAFWDADKSSLDLDKLGSAYTERDAAFAAAAERAKLIPETPDAYKLELPQDFVLPEGVNVTFDDKAPIIGELRAAAHELGIPQAGLSKLLALQTKFQMESEKAFQEQEKTVRAEENKKLGEGADARRTAIKSAWQAAGLTDQEVAELSLNLSRAAGVTAYEKIIAAMNGTRMPDFRQADPPKPAPPSIESRWYPNQASQQKAS